MFLEIARQAAEGTGVEEIFTIDPSDASPLTGLMGEPLAEQVEVSPDDVVVLLLVRDHRTLERRDADPSQLRCQSGSDDSGPRC